MSDVIEGMSATRFVGQRVPRREDARLITGEGQYVDDVQLPGTLHAAFVRSPFARARIDGIDTSMATDVDGVVAVYTATDLNHLAHEQWHTAAGDVPETPRPPLAATEVRCVGDPVALVVATSRYIAEDAAELVDVEYEPLTPVVDYREAEGHESVVHEQYPDNLAGRIPGPPPEVVAEAFASAAHVVRETVSQHQYMAVPIECRGIVAHWTRASRELTVYASTQVPHEVRAFGARLLNIPEHQIRVVMRDTGGGFGQKVNVQREEMCILIAATLLDDPLKWIEDRNENLLHAGKSRREQGECGLAFDEDGHLLAVSIDFVADAGAYPSPTPGISTAAVGAIFPGPYKVPKASFTTAAVYTNTAGRTAYRGPWQFESVAREVLLDIAARRMGIDPAELRRRNLLSHADLPYQNPTFFRFEHVTPLETFEAALDAIDYDGFRAEQERARAEGRFIGIGTATYIEPTTPGYGVYGTEGATIRIEPSGTVNVYMAGGSSGNSLETTVIQLVADQLGVDVDDVNTIQGDTAITPFGAGTGGSRSGSMTAGAIRDTTEILRDRIARIAAHKLEAAPEDIVLGDGKASVRGTPTAALTYSQLAQMAYLAPAELPEGLPAGLEATGRYTSESGSIFANATHVCTCEVDVETGQVTLLRYVVGEDCGPMINPNVVEGQIAGGTVQGIGGVLYEEMPYDEEGNPLATSFVDYLLPTTTETPDIEYAHVVSMGPGPGGHKGVGEGGAIGAPPAVINAVADALAPFGVEILDQPLSPNRLLDLIDAAGKGGSS